MIREWSFQKKLGFGFGVMVALAAVIAAVGWYALRTVVATKDFVITVNGQNLIDAAKLVGAVHTEVAGFRGFLLLTDERFLKDREAGREQFAEVFARMEGNAYTGEGKRALAEIQRGQAEFLAIQDRIIAQRRGNTPMEKIVEMVVREALPARNLLTQRVDMLVAREERSLAEGRTQSNQTAATASTLVAGFAALAVLFAVGAALLLSRTLSRRIGAAVQHVQNSSTELQTTASQQATGSKEAVTAMNEISTTMSELLATSRQITESAQQVAQIAQETAAAARGGDQTVASAQQAIEGIRRQTDIVVGHMLELGKKSQQIGGILDIINELAEQTNILSINATIEAAGAGEQGKRFAVVGEEIRKLADRVSGSTKEIRALVEEIRTAVNTTVLATEGGSKAVDSGLRQFEEVTRGFKQIAGLVATTTQAAREIELSTKQQMTAVEQVNAAVQGAAQATRETEVSSSQTLQTATQLARLSHDLSEIVQPNAAG